MIGTMRTRFGKIVIGIIVGLICFVFVFFGVFSPDAAFTGGTAGAVNGEPISLAEFNRELRRRMEFFKGLGGGLTEEQLKSFRIKEGIFNELVNRRLLVQEAERIRDFPSDQEVRSRIQEIPAFKDEGGNFDVLKYKDLLKANGYTPSVFERMVRSDIIIQRWRNKFKSWVKVSDSEVEREFRIENTKRKLSYVVITPEAARKVIKVSGDEITKFFEDESKANLAKNRYEAEKDTTYKGKTYEKVKKGIARDLIAKGKNEEIEQIRNDLATQVEKLMSESQLKEKAVNQLLKPYGLELKKSAELNPRSAYIPGIGESKEVLADTFSKQSVLDPKKGGKAKIFKLSTGVVVAVVVEAKDASSEGVSSDQREEIISRLSNQKERDFYDAWIKKLTESADIKKNEQVVGS